MLQPLVAVCTLCPRIGLRINLTDELALPINVAINILWESPCQIVLQPTIGLRFLRVSDQVIPEIEMPMDIGMPGAKYMDVVCSSELVRLWLGLL